MTTTSKRAPNRWMLWAASLVSCLAVALTNTESSLGQAEFEFYLRDGTVFRANLSDATIGWMTIASDKDAAPQDVPLSDVQRVDFATTSVGDLVIPVTQALLKLNSPDYHVRNQAEQDLQEKGADFVDLIQLAKSNTNPEVRYRVNRVLSKFHDKSKGQSVAEYDQMLLVGNPQPIRGDAADWSPTVDIFGRSIRLSRKTLRSICKCSAVESESAPTTAAKTDYRTATFSKPDNEFFLPDDSVADFDTGRPGEILANSSDISHTYLFAGVVLSAVSDNPATVIKSTFPINGKSRGGCAGTIATKFQPEQYKWPLKIEFCEPGSERVPATVHRLGCYVGLVARPREIVLTAFDRNGDILAVSEAMQGQAFVGLESPFPIAYAIVHSNTDLKVENIDNTFAIDDLVFEPPQTDSERSIRGKATVYLNDGSRFIGDGVELSSDTVRLQHADSIGQDLEFPRKRVRSIATAQAMKTDRARGLWAALRDGSMLPVSVKSNDTVQYSGFDKTPFRRSDLAAIFGSDHPLRMPLASDVGHDKIVIVKPTESWLIEEFTLSDSRVSWTAEEAELREPITLTDSEHHADATSEYALADAPSIWLTDCPRVTASDGRVETTDGRIFVLGGSAGFEMTAASPSNVTIQRGDQSLDIPFSDVTLIRFPRQ